MTENWDKFPINICESIGPIERKGFVFNYNRFEVWQAGRCIYKNNSNGNIIANVVNGSLHVTIDDIMINDHIIRQFSFGEISYNNERILWSKDLLNTSGNFEFNNPDISSLFFKNGILSKVTYTINNPNTLVEFYQTFPSALNLNFTFKSSDHLRYENGFHVSGPHGGAGRVVKVEPNILGGKGFSVSIYNLDGNHPLWQNNVQMAPKQMDIVEQADEKVVLRGYGYDNMGSSFADYGLTIHFKNGEVNECILHMHDRSVDIKYLK